MTLKRQTMRIAELPTWIALTRDTGELDFQNNPYKLNNIVQNQNVMCCGWL